MIVTSGVALAAFLIVAEPKQAEIVLRHDLGPEYVRIDMESACGPTVVRIRFQNGTRQGRVEHVRIGGLSVPDAAEQLEVRAARRVIDRIGIMNCGVDPERPVFRGVMELSELESQRLRMPPSVYFRLSRQNGGSWQIHFD